MPKWAKFVAGVVIVIFVIWLLVVVIYFKKVDASKKSQEGQVLPAPTSSAPIPVVVVSMPTVEVKVKADTPLPVALVSVPELKVKCKKLKPTVTKKKVCTVKTAPPVVETPKIVKQPPKETPKAVVRKEPTKLVIVKNDTEDCEIVIMETFPDGGFKGYHLLKDISSGDYRNVAPGGEHGIGIFPGSRGLTLKVRVINKKGRLKYETRVTRFSFDPNPDRKEKYVWTIKDWKCKSSIYKNGERKKGWKRSSSIIEED